ncbi:MAG TPA: hypothetical protein VFV83_02415, partial [Chthoniobacteraceae bacterium]|nr:hypothetical protein [Chthoniobacteraceae bacterium]
ASDATGVLRASGSHLLATGETSLHVASNLNLGAASNAFRIAPFMNDFVFQTPPDITLDATSMKSPPGSWRGLGHVAVGPFAYKSVPFEKLESDFSFEENRWSVRAMRLVHRTGELAGDMVNDRGQVQSRFINTLHRPVLRPILHGELGELYAQLTFVNPS